LLVWGDVEVMDVGAESSQDIFGIGVLIVCAVF